MPDDQGSLCVFCNARPVEVGITGLTFLSCEVCRDEHTHAWQGASNDRVMQGAREEAARFSSEQAAMQSPAYSFPLTFFKPEALDG